MHEQRDDRGAAAVEFAFLLVPFLVLVFGVIQYSAFFFAAQSTTFAAREAARRASVGDQSCPEMVSAARSAAGLVEGDFTVTRSYYPPTTTAPDDSSTPRAAGAVKVGDTIRVVVSYRSSDLHFPFIPVPSTNGARLVVREAAVSRLEYLSSDTVACS